MVIAYLTLPRDTESRSIKRSKKSVQYSVFAHSGDSLNVSKDSLIIFEVVSISVYFISSSCQSCLRIECKKQYLIGRCRCRFKETPLSWQRNPFHFDLDAAAPGCLHRGTGVQRERVYYLSVYYWLNRPKRKGMLPVLDSCCSEPGAAPEAVHDFPILPPHANGKKVDTTFASSSLLFSSHPNPFNRSTVLQYVLHAPSSLFDSAH